MISQANDRPPFLKINPHSSLKEQDAYDPMNSLKLFEDYTVLVAVALM